MLHFSCRVVKPVPVTPRVLSALRGTSFSLPQVAYVGQPQITRLGKCGMMRFGYQLPASLLAPTTT
jgi:hypothetical protein